MGAEELALAEGVEDGILESVDVGSLVIESDGEADDPELVGEALAEPVGEALAEPVGEALAEPVGEALAEPVGEALAELEAVAVAPGPQSTVTEPPVVVTGRLLPYVPAVPSSATASAGPTGKPSEAAPHALAWKVTVKSGRSVFAGSVELPSKK
jgi:hypothetical protein